MITRDNYEIVFIDFMDGILSTTEIEEMEIFLIKNPDLKVELDNLTSFQLEESSVLYPQKTMLYKTELDDQTTFNNLALKVIEGDNSNEELLKFNKYLELRPEKKREFRLFQLAKSLPVPSISFPNKSNLYKRRSIIPFFRPLTAIAATLTLLIGITLLFKSSPTNTQNNIANVETPKIINVIKDEPSVTSAMENTLQEKVENEVVNTEIKTREQIKQKVNSTVKFTKLTPIPAKVPEEINRVTMASLDYRINNTVSDEKFNPLKEYFKLKKKLTNVNYASLVPKVQVKDMLLSALNNISNNKIQVTKDSNGKVQKLNYNSELLAFTIPFE